MVVASRQQAVTGMNVDSDLCRHMASTGWNELNSNFGSNLHAVNHQYHDRCCVLVDYSLTISLYSQTATICQVDENGQIIAQTISNVQPGETAEIATSVAPTAPPRITIVQPIPMGEDTDAATTETTSATSVITQPTTAVVTSATPTEGGKNVNDVIQQLLELSEQVTDPEATKQIQQVCTRRIKIHISPLHGKFFRRNINIYNLYHSSTMSGHKRQLKSLLM